MPLRMKNFFCAAVLLLMCFCSHAQNAPSAHLAAPHALASTVQLEDLTWTELQAKVLAGYTTALIPIGGTEQSGPHLALGKHNARVKVLAQLIAERLGHALVAPVLAYTPEGSYAPPTSHMKFPGTITVPDAAFESLLASAANSLKIHGFTTVVFLGDHGSYQRNLQRVAQSLNKAWGPGGPRALVPLAYYQSSAEGYAALLRQQGYTDNEIGTHAGLADTSLQLAVAPQMVRQDRLQNGTHLGSSDGVYGGNPRRSSASIGQMGVDLIIARTVEDIRKATGSR